MSTPPYELRFSGAFKVNASLSEATRGIPNMLPKTGLIFGFHGDLVPVAVVFDGIFSCGAIFIVPESQESDTDDRCPAERQHRRFEPILEGLRRVREACLTVGERDADIEYDPVGHLLIYT